MKITLSPLRNDRAIDIRREGDALVIDGVRVDLSSLPNGTTCEAEELGSPWILGDVTRDAQGVLHLMLAVPHGAQAGDTARFVRILEDPADGPLNIPYC